MQISKTVNCSIANEIIDEVNYIVNRWNYFAIEVGVKLKLRNTMDKTLMRL